MRGTFLFFVLVLSRYGNISEKFGKILGLLDGFGNGYGIACKICGRRHRIYKIRARPVIVVVLFAVLLLVLERLLLLVVLLVLGVVMILRIVLILIVILIVFVRHDSFPFFFARFTELCI